MPKKSTKKQLEEAQAKQRDLEAQLAHLQSQNKRTSSPQEALKVAESAKKTSAKKQKKSIQTSGSDDSGDDKLKTYKLNITKTIVKEIFPTTKFITGPGTKKKLCFHILHYGKAIFGKLKKHERLNWVTEFGDFAVTELNSLRSTVSTAIKNEFKAKHEQSDTGDIGSVARWEACLTRDLSTANAQDMEDYEFYYNTLMDKATGFADRWNIAHRGYMTLCEAKPPRHCPLIEPAKGDEDRIFYVTPETEAYALLIIRGSFDKWRAQFETQRKFPGYKLKPFHKTPEPEKIAASNAIKQELFLALSPAVAAAPLPDDWLDSMTMAWEDDENYVSV